MDQTHPIPSSWPETAPAVSIVVVTLLKGVLYQDDNMMLWSQLLQFQAQCGIMLPSWDWT